MGIGKEDQNSNRQYTHNKEAEQSLAESNEESTAVLAPETRNQSRVSKQEKESHSPLLITVICIPLLLISSFVFGDELAKAFVFVRAHAASLRHVNPQAQSTRIEYIETPYLIYRNAGMEALAARKKRQSKYFFEQALIESEKENGPVSLAKAAELEHLYTASENWEEAAKYAQLIASNQLLMNGPRDAVLGDAYRMSAFASFKEGRPSQALQLTKKARAIYERSCDPGSSKFEWLKRLEQEKVDYSVSLDARTRHKELPLGSWSNLPKPHFNQLSIVSGIAYDSKEPSDLAKYNQAIEMGRMSEPNGCDEQCTATIMNDYACMLRRLGRVNEAKVIEEKVDAIRVKYYGVLSPLDDK